MERGGTRGQAWAASRRAQPVIPARERAKAWREARDAINARSRATALDIDASAAHPLVKDVVRAINSRMADDVLYVERKIIRRSYSVRYREFRPYTDFDVETHDAVIEVTGGTHKQHKPAQLRTIMHLTCKQVILFAPNFSDERLNNMRTGLRRGWNRKKSGDLDSRYHAFNSLPALIDHLSTLHASRASAAGSREVA